MILFDTDHLSVLMRTTNSGYAQITQSMIASSDQEFCVCAINLEEHMRGWLAAIARHTEAPRQVPAYERLVELVEFYQRWKILPFDTAAADEAERLRALKIRISTSDRKIAAVALANGATLITSNAVDFGRVPGLRFEDWRLH
jgi:tRNA(fMet)-specific endonuclease VapC